MEWSVYFQNPEFIEKTRFHLIQPDMEPLVRKWCGVKAGSSILDVGCGTGYFTRLLAKTDTKEQEDPGISVTGLDREQPFIEYARKRNEKEDLPVSYVQGDALDLPFEEDSFDIVTSHTFLTVISKPQKALSEMLRVLRPGGILASVTPMSFFPEAIDTGAYPSECTWAGEFTALTEAIYTAYNKIDPVMGYAAGVKPALVPRFLATNGLEKVSAYPLGKLFSLSNAAVTEEEKKEWITFFEISELKKLDIFMELREMQELVSREKAERYRMLLKEKCKWLRSHLQENTIWEWSGGANLLVTGYKPE